MHGLGLQLKVVSQAPDNAQVTRHSFNSLSHCWTNRCQYIFSQIRWLTASSGIYLFERYALRVHCPTGLAANGNHHAAFTRFSRLAEKLHGIDFHYFTPYGARNHRLHPSRTI
jgi:hypothetical protein